MLLLRRVPEISLYNAERRGHHCVWQQCVPRRGDAVVDAVRLVGLLFRSSTLFFLSHVGFVPQKTFPFISSEQHTQTHTHTSIHTHHSSQQHGQHHYDDRNDKHKHSHKARKQCHIASTPRGHHPTQPQGHISHSAHRPRGSERHSHVAAHECLSYTQGHGATPKFHHVMPCHKRSNKGSVTFSRESIHTQGQRVCPTHTAAAFGDVFAKRWSDVLQRVCVFVCLLLHM